MPGADCVQCPAAWHPPCDSRIRSTTNRDAGMKTNLEPRDPEHRLIGSVDQVEWAERIKAQVYIEFDRVAAAFQVVAARQNDVKRAETEEIIAILEEKRSEVMSREQAGYF